MAALPEVIAEAKRLFRLGYQVIAVRADKRPWGKDWRRIHTLEEVIALLEGPDCPAIGFLGGEFNHWIVPIDFDTEEGDAWFRANCNLAGIDPDGFPTVITPGKIKPDGSRHPGLHRYMTDVRRILGNATGPLLKKLGIDIRGAGHAMLPPSEHPDGGTYQWLLAHNLLTDFPHGVPPCPLFLYEAIEARYGLEGAAEKPGEPEKGNGADPAPDVQFRAPPPPSQALSTTGVHLSPTGVSISNRAEAYCRKALADTRERLAAVPPGGRNAALNTEALKLAHLAHYGVFGEGEARAALMAAMTDNGYIAEHGPKAALDTFASGWNDGIKELWFLPDDPPRPHFGSHSEPEWPRIQSSAPSADASNGAEQAETGQENQGETEPPLQGFTPQDWADRDIPPADFLLGDLFSTTSRVMIGGPTGLGKTQLALMWAFAMAAGADFLHWSARRAARVLYLDGEMSRRLAKERIVSAIKRFGQAPDNLVFINKEDFETMPPLNSEPGQAFVDHLIRQYGPFDFLTIDNIQAWCPGDLKSPESWELVLPWIRQLTKRSIGQLWIHHTGHEEDRLYGDKSREWQLDTVGLMIKPKCDDEDENVSPDRLIEFKLEFTKARERSPTNRNDFDPVTIWLDQDEGWQSDRGRVLRAMAPKRRRIKVPAPTPLDERFYEALAEALASPQAEPMEASAWRKATTIDNWRASCVNLGLLDKGKPDSARSMMSKYRTRLIDLKWVAIRGGFAWSTKEGSPLSEECERPQNPLNVKP